MALTALDILTARAGSYILNNTNEYTGTVYAIIVLEDTVFNTIKIAGVDAKSSYIGTPATAVKAGAIITPLDTNKPFSGVDLTSGSVALVRG